MVSYSSNPVWVIVTQSCPTLCDPMDCSPTGFSVHGILQARILERVAISFSKGSSRPRDWTDISYIDRKITINLPGKVLVAQSCLTLCDPMDYSLPSFSVHGILQARILECVAIPFSRGSSRARNHAWVFYIAGRFFTIWDTREAPYTYI